MNQRFGKHVGGHVVGSAVHENNNPVIECFVNVVVVNGDVLGAGMEGSVLNKFDRGAVVAVDSDGIVEDLRRVEF